MMRDEDEHRESRKAKFGRGIRGVWRLESRVSSQLPDLLAQTPPRHQRADVSCRIDALQRLRKRNTAFSPDVKSGERFLSGAREKAMPTQTALAMLPAARGTRNTFPRSPIAARASTAWQSSVIAALNRPPALKYSPAPFWLLTPPWPPDAPCDLLCQSLTRFPPPPASTCFSEPSCPPSNDRPPSYTPKTSPPSHTFGSNLTAALPTPVKMWLNRR